MATVNGIEAGAGVVIGDASNPLDADYVIVGDAGDNSVAETNWNTAATELRKLSSLLTYDGGGGVDRLVLQTQDTPTPVAVTINTESNVFGIGGISVSNVEQIQLQNTFVDDTITVTGINGYELTLDDYSTAWGPWRAGTAAFVLDLTATSRSETIQTALRFDELDVVAGTVKVNRFEDVKLLLGSGNDTVNLSLDFTAALSPADFHADGGAGIDVLRITSTSGAGVVLDAPPLSAGSFSFKGFETYELISDAGNDRLVGDTLNDVLRSGLGNDSLTGGGGNDTLDGGVEYDRAPDTDTAFYSGKSGDYSATRLSDGRIKLTDLRAGSPDGTDITKNIEIYQFTDGSLSNAQLAPPIITPVIAGTPKSILPDFTISATPTSNSQAAFPATGYDMVALSNGRFLVTWTTAKSATTGTDVKARVINPDGTPVGPEFSVNTTVARNQSSPDVVQLKNGTVLIAWASDEGVATGTDIRARLFDAAGKALGADFVLNPISSDPALTTKDQTTPALLALKDGSLLATWQSEGVFDGSYAHDPSGIEAQFFTAAAVAAGASFQIEAPSHQHLRNIGLGELPDGRVLLTEDSFEPSRLTKTTLITREGSLASTFPNAGAGFAEAQGLASAVLADGRVVEAFFAYRVPNAFNLPNNLIMAQIIGTDGLPENLAFVVGRSTSAPSITALANGHFAITWTDYSDASSFDIRMRIYNTDGSAAGADFVVNSTTAGRQTLSKVVELSDGRIAVTWESTDAKEATSIHGTVIDLGTGAPLPGGDRTGTAQADTLAGDSAANILLGLGGDDTLAGGAGADTLRGGTGRDWLDGGDDADMLFGDAGNDVLWGGLGADVLNGGKGVDRYRYASAAEGGDTIVKFEKGERIAVDGAAFGFGAYTGKLSAAHFKSGSTKKASDGNDHFIFRQGDDTLWFDADGKGGSASVKLVDLANDFDLSAANIWIV